ncbi:chloride transporter, ClC family [Dictyocaulus viviparus]|uniref:Chloride transporter, ClC family n=1 Tax=Dictyocaulus viviparus TaxID=29172 RepID=A0A0D8XLQ2_DICVI|nr:chloride transporter, ClC family [Dictyocaulus viviparus]
MHGFKMENYLTFRTLIAKMVGLTLAMGSGLPIGKEGPFVHIGAIVATLLSRITASCQYSAFFSNEGREIEMLSSGCAVGIACTFSAPIGAVLYAIESTSKYFAVKNYWRSFLAATCSAIIFRFANFFVTAEQSDKDFSRFKNETRCHLIVLEQSAYVFSGTITAFYQTRFPTDAFLIEELPIFMLLGKIIWEAKMIFGNFVPTTVYDVAMLNDFIQYVFSGTITAFYQTRFPTDAFLIEELPIFMLLGFVSGMMGAIFIFMHRQISMFRQKNHVFKKIFRNDFLTFTVFMSLLVGILTYPQGFGRFIAGKISVISLKHTELKLLTLFATLFIS